MDNLSETDAIIADMLLDDWDDYSSYGVVERVPHTDRMAHERHPITPDRLEVIVRIQFGWTADDIEMAFANNEDTDALHAHAITRTLDSVNWQAIIDHLNAVDSAA
jgi:hypothetical protein